ncbi:type 1 glutamine amidotransferase [Synechococcus sp. CCY9201]|uniref:type 1 glutamine amidotransferase n=1 Tax=unclassified Synechococcus TaxID=2626047 RepID=UPI002AD4CB49|nr:MULTISPECIES: type 1 glutamine amidotransferase [unclassified Synechococcus]MEA5473428.1 type 1 glutamine amidotransferase [Synechococcus sp. CCY9201]CAK6696209.1 hypothetical protein IFHNHDMJ_01978 [Synechococcus sp. CBW1107]
MTELLVIQHLDREGPGRFAGAARARGWQVSVCRPDRGEALPAATPNGTPTDQVLLVLGGPMGVADLGNDAFPWLEAELELIRQRVEAQQPVLGICLGAQLLARAMGGDAVPLEVGEPPRPLREVGWGAVTWTTTAEQEAVLQGLAASELVLHWHGDRIVLPPGATLLASSLHCVEQMFRIGRHAWGLQFHLEVTPELLEPWLLQDRAYVIEALGADGVERIRRDGRHWQASTEASATLLIENLLSALEACLRR